MNKQTSSADRKGPVVVGGPLGCGTCTRTHSHGVMSHTEFHLCSEQLQPQVRPTVVPPQNFPNRGSVTSRCSIPVRCRLEGFSRTSYGTVQLKPAPAPVLTPRSPETRAEVKTPRSPEEISAASSVRTLTFLTEVRTNRNGTRTLAAFFLPELWCVPVYLGA